MLPLLRQLVSAGSSGSSSSGSSSREEGRLRTINCLNNALNVGSFFNDKFVFEHDVDKLKLFPRCINKQVMFEKPFCD